MSDEKKISRQELIQKRKRLQAQREMQNSLASKLERAHREQEEKERFYQQNNRYVVGAINFLGSIVMGELILFVIRIFVRITGLGFFFGAVTEVQMVLRILFYGLAIISAFQRKSLMEGIFRGFMDFVSAAFGFGKKRR